MEDVLSKLGEKVLTLQSYEALQYIQSFVARKKKVLGKSQTSICVFHGVSKLIERDASIDAGVLLVWFIESEDLFTLGETPVVLEVGRPGEEETYCDIQRILDLLSKLTPQQSGPICERIYSPLHRFVVKAHTKRNGDVAARMEQVCVWKCVCMYIYIYIYIYICEMFVLCMYVCTYVLYVCDVHTI